MYLKYTQLALEVTHSARERAQHRSGLAAIVSSQLGMMQKTDEERVRFEVFYVTDPCYDIHVYVCLRSAPPGARQAEGL